MHNNEGRLLLFGNDFYRHYCFSGARRGYNNSKFLSLAACITTLLLKALFLIQQELFQYFFTR